ncbi:hypothetical protein HK098_004061 [Nowakowskiella sp. JEL0407]|nr:hypothetical protein HK098_004061 [Nowakowskiella sp. JEL0407]
MFYLLSTPSNLHDNLKALESTIANIKFSGTPLPLDTPDNSQLDYEQSYLLIRAMQSHMYSFFMDEDILAAQVHLNRSGIELYKQEKKLTKTSFDESDPKISMDDLYFVIMGSSKNKDRIKLLRKTWLGWVKESNFVIFADEEDSESKMITIPELKGKPTYDDAQHRQLKGIKYIYAHNSSLIESKKWIILVDDDTWLNIPALIRYLIKFDYKLPMGIGWVHLLRKTTAIYSGGAAMIFSKPAMDLIAPNLYTDVCPFATANDVTLSQCVFNLRVLKVKSNRFLWTNLEIHGPKVKVHDGKKSIWPGKHGAQISYHWIKEKDQMIKMTCLAGLQFRDPVPGLKCDSTWDQLGISHGSKTKTKR